MALRCLRTPHHIYFYEVCFIETDLEHLTSKDIQPLLRRGANADQELADIKAGKTLLLADPPQRPLFHVNHKQLIVNGKHGAHNANLLAALKGRFEWEMEGEDKNSIAHRQAALGVSANHGEGRATSEPAIDDVYSPEPPKPDEEKIKWEILINEELYRFAPNHHNLNKGLPVQIEDNLGIKQQMTVDGLKLSVMLSASVESCVLTFFPEGNQITEPCDEVWPNSQYKKMLGNSIKLTKKDWLSANTSKMSLRIPAAKGAILHPSLTCPVLGNPQQAQPISVLLALEPEFITQQFERDKDTLTLNNGIKEGGPWARRAIHTQLCCNPIQQPQSEKIPKDKTLFQDHHTAINHMRVYHLGSLTGERQLITNHKGEPWTVLRQSSAQWYQSHSFTELVQVDIDPAALSGLAKGGSQLYDLAWTSLDEKGEAFFITRDKANSPSNPHIEQQDLEQAVWHQTDETYKQGLYSLASIAGSNRHNIKDLHADTGEDHENQAPHTHPSVKQRHPLYLSTKPLLNPGQLTDVHISSRQHIYTASKAQVIPGAATEDSPYLGELCNIAFLTLKNLMDQMGQNKDIDVLVFTGDLVDYCINLDPEQCKNVSNTGGIWEYMTAEKESSRQIYPKYIDDLMAFGLFDYFLTTYKKPIILISGNHEAYDMPYGISPRVLGQRANAGIPADHNLTIYEACLLYGKEYDHLHNSFNFEANNFEWFYQVFCPMSDFILTHDQQQWVGLEWGDNEDFLETMSAGGGVLPRATESCNTEQLQLVEHASQDESKPERLLMTHFTLVNFPTGGAIGDTWRINTNDVGIHSKLVYSAPDLFSWLPVTIEYKIGDRDNGEEGSFHKGRKALYQEHVLTGRFKYCLAGHSHRAGLYQAANIMPFNFEATGILPQDYQPNAFGDNRPRILVSGSGGPVSKQNIQGELAGQGMDTSQGTWIDVTKDEFHVVTADSSQVPQAQPRFAVALDYMALVAGEPVLQGFKASNIEAGQFEIWLNKALPQTQFIDQIKLHYVDKYSLAPIGKLTWEIEWTVVNGQVKLTLGGKEWKAFYKETKELGDVKDLIFYLSVHFNSTLSQQRPYQAYRFDSPWCFPVTLAHHRQVNYQRDILTPEHWQIARTAEEPRKADYNDLRKKIMEYKYTP